VSVAFVVQGAGVPEHKLSGFDHVQPLARHEAGLSIFAQEALGSPPQLPVTVQPAVVAHASADRPVQVAQLATAHTPWFAPSPRQAQST
jgi:hypothetical protein